METVHTRTILRSRDLTCPSCIVEIERALGRLEGVSECAVHFSTGRIEVLHDSSLVAVEALTRAVSAVGYAATPAPF